MSIHDYIIDFDGRYDWLFDHSLLWLLPGLVTGTIIVFSYLVTHPFPAFGAGLYLLMADRIVETGYALPNQIPHYTSGGLPFAYPPFGFYLAAFLRDSGIQPLTIARLVSGIITIVYLVPAYFLAYELLHSKPKAALTTVILTVTPPVLQWHISAGGFVRASALTFTIIGLYGGLRLFRDQNQRWLPITTGAFTLTILAHPQYTIFFVASFALQWLWFDRSVQGLWWATFVGLGGSLLTSIWWGQIIQVHGVDVFLAAAGAQGGIGSNLTGLARIFKAAIWQEYIVFFWGPFTVLGGLYLIVKRQIFLPAWLLLSATILGKARFPFFVGAFISAVFIVDVVRIIIQRHTKTRRRLRVGISCIIIMFAAIGLVGGTLYATSSINTHGNSQSLPQFIDENDINAMQWIQRNTASDAQFVVLSDAAEWFPQQAHRTILVGPWGTEWRGQSAYRSQIRRFKRLSTCENSTCITSKMHRANLDPEYLYVPKQSFTVRGVQYFQSPQTIVSMRESSHYRQIYENPGVAVFAIRNGTRPRPLSTK